MPRCVTSRTGSPEKAGYLPGLDGVRGVAILLVFVHHAVRRLPYTDGHEALIHRIATAGWIGVDLFFVLSGFLITGILLGAKGKPGYFRTFYARRVLRIVPVYLVFVSFVVWIAPAVDLLTADERARIHDAQGWYWAHTVNILIARMGWGTATWHSGHLWSLSLEEQFYLLWPALVLVLTHRSLIRATIIIVLGASLLRAVLVWHAVSWTTIYVLLPTRMDSLAIGALLAALAQQPRAWRSLERSIRPAALLGGLVLAILFARESLVRSGPLTQIGGYAALAVLGAAIVVSAANAPAGSHWARFWTHPALRLFGRYSYGLYVWHTVVIALLYEHAFAGSVFEEMSGSHVPGYVLFTAAALALSLAVALASWYLIEAPFLALKRHVPRADQETREVISRSRSSVAALVEGGLRRRRRDSRVYPIA